LKESKINSIHTYSYKNNFNLNNSLLINPNNFSETLIDIIEYLSVITVNDKTLKKFTIPETIKNKFKGLTNTNIIEITNDLLLKNSIIFLGSNLKNHPDFQLLKILTNIISIYTKSNTCYLGEKSNEAGAWLTGCLPKRGEGFALAKHQGFNVKESIQRKLDSYIIYNLDLIDFYYYSELKKSLENSKFVLGFQSFVTEEEKTLYDVILPLATTFESPGTFINIEKEWQSFAQGCMPHYDSKEGWKILTKLRLESGNQLSNSLDYIDILNEVDRIIRNTESIEPSKIENYKINEITSNSYLTRTGGNYCYFSDNITRRSISLNTVNKNKNLVCVNKKTLVENNIDLEKNKVILKQGDKSLLVKLLVDENVSDNCIYISNSNREHFELGKQYQPIVIENV